MLAHLDLPIARYGGTATMTRYSGNRHAAVAVAVDDGRSEAPGYDREASRGASPRA